jgi:hypothetical protein
VRAEHRLKQREWVVRFLLVVLSVCGTLAGLEIVLRVFVDRYRCDDRLGWTYRPNRSVLVFNWTGEFAHFVHFNRSGMREDRELPSGRDGHAFRIVVLGDSFSAGLQVPADKSFPKLLESKLRSEARPGQTIEIWNAAVDGFGTAQELRMFEEQVASFEPNLVLLGLFLANDLGDNVPGSGSRNHYLATRCRRPYLGLDLDGSLVEIRDAPSRRSSTLDRLLRRSQLYANLFPQADSTPESLSDWDVFTGKNADAVAAAWRLTGALIRDLDMRVQMRGARLVVVLMPHEREARPEPAAQDVQPTKVSFERAHALAERFLRQERIAYIDLYPRLRAEIATGKRPYLDRDMHWNSLGHRIVFEAIWRWLRLRCPDLGLPIEGCQSSSGTGMPGPRPAGAFGRLRAPATAAVLPGTERGRAARRAAPSAR